MSGHAATIAAALSQAASGKMSQAVASIQRLVQRHPADVELNHTLGILLLKSGQAAQARFYLERAIRGAPDRAGLHSNMGATLATDRKWTEALPWFRRSIELDPAHAPGWAGLAQGLADIHDFDRAADAAAQLVTLRPDLADGYNNGALALANAGRIQEAVALARRGAETLPADSSIHRNLTGLLAYTPEVETPQFVDQCRTTGKLLMADAGQPAPFDYPRDPGRSLRVGFLSSDLRRHSVAFFLEPILEHHDRAAIHTVCYMTSEETDDFTNRLRSLSDSWVDASRLNAAALAERIRADRIDILIELCGYSRGGRLAVMARRPAPVQATFLGWPTTTGVPTIDWRIVDSITDPPGSEHLSTERLLRLDPSFLCYRPPADAPDVSSPSAVITFGSFNVLSKIGPETVALWSRVLSTTPGSRLILKAAALDRESTRTRLLERFSSHDIDSSRIDLLSRTASLTDHLRLYGRVDIALDTTPYNGTTTTCEALYMGVPVVTLVGRAHASRVGATLLHAVGLDELAAADPDQFVSLASQLATDPARRTTLRASLRARILQSILCDGTGYARRFDSGLRAMWSAWCTQ